MRTPTLILFLTLSICSYSQSKYSSFSGGIELGYGVSTLIDFNRETNGLVKHEFLLLLPFQMPYQFGFFADKYVNKTDYLEFGLVYAKRGAAYIWQEIYSNGRHTALPFANLYCVDIPIRYYKGGFELFNKDFLSFVGIIPSLLYLAEFSEKYYDIPDAYIHKAFVSLTTGISHQKSNRRLRLQLSSAVTSITKWKYKVAIQALNEKYRGVVFPLEVMFVWGWVIG